MIPPNILRGSVIHLLKLSLTFLALSVLIGSMRASDCQMPAGLLMWHRLDTPTSLAAGEISGALATGVEFVPGRFGQAMQLGGTGSGVRFVPATIPAGWSEFTLDAWIRRGELIRSATDGEGGVIFGGGPGAVAFALLSDGRLTLSAAGVSRVDSLGAVTDLNWHHVAVTRSAGAVRFYIDGQPAGSATFSAMLEAGERYGIGRFGDSVLGLTGTFVGQLDEVGLFRRALDVVEIAQIAGALDGSKCLPVRANLIVQAPAAVNTDTEFVSVLRIENPFPIAVSNVVATVSPAGGWGILGGDVPAGTVILTEGRAVVTVPVLAAGARIEASIVGKSSVTPGQASVRATSAGVLVSEDAFAIVLPCTRMAGTVARWLFEGSGVEEVGGQIGALRGRATWAEDPGRLGQVLNLGGGSDALLVSNPSPLGLDTFSVSLWFRRTDPIRVSQDPIGGVIAASSSGSYSVGLATDGSLFFSQVDVVLSSAPTKVTDMAWHHLAMVREAGAIVFYLDGTFAGGIPFTGTFGASTAFSIGSLPTISNGLFFGFIGRVDDVQVFNRQLTVGEVSILSKTAGNAACPSLTQIEASRSFTNLVKGTEGTITYLVSNPSASRATGMTFRVEGNAFVALQAIAGPTGPGVIVSNGATLSLGDLRPGESRRVVLSVRSGDLGLARIEATVASVDPLSVEQSRNLQQFDAGIECTPPTSGLLSWYRGEGNLLDEAGNQAITAELGVNFGAGRVDRGFVLDGTSGLWRTNASFMDEGAFTVEAWVRPSKVDGAVDSIFYREVNGSSLDTIQFGLGIWGSWINTPNIPAGNLVFYVGGFEGMPNDSHGLVNGGAGVPLDAWTHVALSVSSGRIRAYVNGVKTREVTGFTGSIRKMEAPLGIGTRTQTFENSSFFRFNGGIDEVGLHSRELTEAEVRVIHAAGSLGRCLSDLAASFEPMPATAVAGDSFRARLRIANRGREAVSDVVLSTPIPTGWVVSNTTTSGGTVSVDGGRIVGTFGTLGASGTVNVEMVFQPAGQGPVDLVATVGTSTPELYTGNNVARATVEVGAASVSVFPASGREVGPGRTSVLRVPVRLFAALSRAVSVKYATGLAPATPERAAASAADFQAASGTLEFAPGETEKFVEVVLTGDAVHEFDEVFAVTLSEPTGMALGVSQAVQTIEDDEAVPGVQIGTVRVREGADAVARVPVTLSGPSSVDVDLAWTATPASAVSPADYVGTNGTVRIPAGATTALVEIQVAADAVPEGNEHFAVTLTIPTGPLARVVAGARIVGDVVILDDDVDPSVVRGFEWSVPDSTNPDGTVAAQLAAVTVGGTIASNYSGTVRLTTSPGVLGPRAVRPPRLAITEVLVDVTGEVELQNVSSEVIDLSGWRVHFYDWRRWPLPRTTLVIPAGTTVPRAGVFSIRTTGPSGTGSFPTFRTGVALDWRIENAGVDVADRPVAVLLQDPTGAVEDFFSTQGADPGEIDIPVTVRREDWAGFPVAVSGFAVASHQRRGWMRSGTAADWILGVPSLRARNPWLRVPFADGVVTAVTPAVVATFENGRWAGALQLATGARGVRILAEDGGGRIGVSPLVLTPGEETLRIVEFSSSRPFASSSPATSFRVVVSNGTPASVVGTDLTVHLDGGFGLNVRSRLTRLSISQGTAALSSAPQNGLWPIRSALGSVAPGGVVVLEFSLNLEGLSALSAAATGLSLYALAEVTAPGAVNGFPAHDRRWLELPVAKEPAPVPDRLVGWWRDPASSADVLGQNTMEARINIGTAARHHQPVFRFEGDGELRISHRAGQLPAAGDGLGFAAYVQLEVGRKDRMVVMEKAADTTGKSLAFVILDGRPAVEWDGVAYPVEAAIADLRDGRWHHLVWVLPPGGAPFAVRVDQAPIVVLGAGSGAKPSDIGNGLLRIGGGGGGGGIVGLMQDPILYHEAGDLPTSVPAAEAGPLGRALAELSAVRVRVASPERSLVAGRPQTQWLEVANEGVTTADAVRLVWRSHSGVTVTSASRDGVAVPATKRGDQHLFDVGAIPAGGSVRFRWTFVVPAVGPTLGTVLEIESDLHHRVRGFSRTFVLETDVDADGIGDAWERENGLNPADGLDGFADLDGDGFANRAEYEAGTLPRSAGSVPQVAWSLDGAEAMVLRTATTVDRDYVLERNDRLSGPASWSGVERRPGTGSVIEFRVVFPAHADAQFYRIRPVPLW